MKRILSLIVAVALCLSLTASFAFAAEFVPSIGDKDHPEIVPDGDGSVGQIVGEGGGIISNLDDGCIIITPVSGANSSEDIPEDAKENLLDLYEGLVDGSIQVPYDPSIDPDDMVIRDLIDISFDCDEHPGLLEDGGVLQLTFDLGVAPDDNVVVMVYVDGEWINVELINNGDGTVTCFFNQLGAVVFAVQQSEAPPQTGDFSGNNVIMWAVLMAVSAIALVVCVVVYRRKIADKG